MTIRTRLTNAWSALKGKPAEKPNWDAIPKSYYGMIRSAMRASVPGGWASDHYEETLHFTGWNYIAGHATGLQAAAATVEVSRPTGTVDAWSGKCLRKMVPRRTGAQRYLRPLAKSHDSDQASERDILPEDFGLSKLMNRPNPSQSGGHLRYEASVQLTLTGTTTLVKIPNRFGKAVEMYCVPTCLMTPRPANSQFPRGAYYVSPAATRTSWADDSFVTMAGYQRLAGTLLDMRDIIKVSFPHPLWKDEGYSALAAGSLWTDSSEQIDRSRFAKMQNQADPSIIITPPLDVNPSDNEIERVVQKLVAEWAGAKNAGKFAVAPGGSKIDLVGVSPKDMDWGAGFDQLRNAVMGMHGVPLIAAGITDGGSYAAFYAALKQFITLCVQPRLDWIAEELTYQLAEQWGEGLMIRLIAQSVDDPQVLESQLATDISARSITKRELRQLRGLPPREDDDVWVGDKMSETVTSAPEGSGLRDLAGTLTGSDDRSTGIATGQDAPKPVAAHFDGARRAGSPQIGGSEGKRLRRLERRLKRLTELAESREEREAGERARAERQKLIEHHTPKVNGNGHANGHKNGELPKTIEERFKWIEDLVVKYSPDQPRGQPDNAGEFSSTGGGGTQVAVPSTRDLAQQATARHETNLSQSERNAIEDYTGDHFQAINAALRTGKIDATTERTIKALDSALDKLPPRQGTTFRILNASPELISALEPGKVLSDSAYMSTSKHPPLGIVNGRVGLQVVGKSGRDLSQVSMNPGEGEVLFPRGTKFKVVKVANHPHGGTMAIVQELSEDGTRTKSQMAGRGEVASVDYVIVESSPCIDHDTPSQDHMKRLDTLGGKFDRLESLLKSAKPDPILRQAIKDAAADTNTEPTEAQKESGGYKKGRFTWNGLRIVLENPKGSVRRGVSADGKAWEQKLGAHYGYVSRTEGSDGDHVDVFIGPSPESELVFVIDQVRPDGSFDEHKAVIGATNEDEAREIYLSCYEDDWQGLGQITAMTLEQFKAWVMGNPTEPLALAKAFVKGWNDRKRPEPATGFSSLAKAAAILWGGKEEAKEYP